jgi:hypothetical protein
LKIKTYIDTPTDDDEVRWNRDRVEWQAGVHHANELLVKVQMKSVPEGLWIILIMVIVAVSAYIA